MHLTLGSVSLDAEQGEIRKQHKGIDKIDVKESEERKTKWSKLNSVLLKSSC